MAEFVFSMNVSLDGFVDHDRFGPGERLFRHFVEEARSQSGAVYGRTMYELMRYWDDDQPDWGPEERDFAAAWRALPKWVVSSTLTEVGPRAELVGDDLVAALRALKAEHDGEIEVAGPRLASAVIAHGLIDSYRLYLHPVVLGRGVPYWQAVPPGLRLRSHEEIAEGVLRLVYAPA